LAAKLAHVSNGLFSARELRAHGFSTRAIRASLASGTLSRLRRGWYATPSTPPDLLTAGRVGGRLSCLAALRIQGCWVPAIDDLHVRVSDGVAVTRVPGTRLHRTAQRVGPGLDTPAEALRAALTCADLRTLVIVADSLANRRLLSSHRIAEILTSTPRGRRAGTA